MAMSHAPGLSGAPEVSHCSRAATSASCARSSARPTSRTMCASPAMSLGDSILQTASIAACVSVAITATDNTASERPPQVVHRVGELDATLAQRLDRFVDPPLPRLGRLGAFDQNNEPRSVAVGESVEEALRLWRTLEGFREVGREVDHAWLGVQREIDVDLVAGLDTGLLANF